MANNALCKGSKTLVCFHHVLNKVVIQNMLMVTIKVASTLLDDILRGSLDEDKIVVSVTRNPDHIQCPLVFAVEGDGEYGAKRGANLQ